MELNGVSNIKTILDFLKTHNIATDAGRAELSTALHAIDRNIVYLERYMLAYKDYSDKSLAAAMNKESLPYEPVWHEIIEFPEKFPTLREKLKKL